MQMEIFCQMEHHAAAIQQPSPLEEIRSEVFRQRGIRLFVKRDDLLHPHISGNKWRKLKYNLLEAKRLAATTLITFGGAYSNHLAAVAAAGVQFGFTTLGIVRGEKTEPLNPTLQFLENCGMELVYLNRTSFREKSNSAILEGLKINTEGCYVLPEGGTNCHAIRGAAELIAEIEAQLGSLPDFILTACGTGGTLAGIIAGMGEQGQAFGISVLKGDFLTKDVATLLGNCGQQPRTHWHINTDYHFGGYAKFTPALIDFINHFKKTHGIPLDPIYTGKAFFATFDLAKKGFFPDNSTLVVVHTGGLQGIAGFNERFPGALRQ